MRDKFCKQHENGAQECLHAENRFGGDVQQLNEISYQNTRMNFETGIQSSGQACEFSSVNIG